MSGRKRNKREKYEEKDRMKVGRKWIIREVHV